MPDADNNNFVDDLPALLNEYLPSSTDEIRELKIKLWIIQFSAVDPKNFTSTDLPYLNQIFTIANNVLGNLDLPVQGSSTPISYPNGATHISDTKLQLSLEEVEFITDPIGWNNAGSTCGNYLYENYGSNDCYYDVFLIGDGNFSGCGPLHYCTLVDHYSDYLANLANPNSKPNEFAHAANLLHEIGHSFGLSHSWHSQFADVPCNTCSAAWCDPWNDIGCTNNIMSYARIRKRNLSPYQIAAMHSRLFTNFNTLYLKHDYDPSPNATITITGSETWTVGKTPPGDVVIAAGGELTVQCKVLMAANSKIVVKKGGRLIVDAGHITTHAPKCDGYWDGITVEGNPNSFTIANQGYVLLQNDALIELANTGIKVESGGIVRGFTSTIRDCRYGIYYEEFPRSARYNINLNYFDGCYFGITDAHILDINPLVTLNDLGGLNFNSCQFKDERTVSNPNIIAGLQYTIGIQSNAARFRVGGASEFEGLFLGVSAGATGSSANLSYSIRDATFTDCFGGIVSRAINNAVIMNNTFTLGGYELLTPPGDGGGLPPTHWDGFGISVQSGTSYKIEDNAFFRADFGDATLGIYTNSTSTAYNRLLNNAFTSITVSNYAEGENGALFPSRNGLEYLCNTNNGSTAGAIFDFYVAPGGRIRPAQGSEDDPSGNSFRDPGFATGNDFHNAPDAYEVGYFYDEQIANQEPEDDPDDEIEEIVNVVKIALPEDAKCGGDTGEDDKETLKPNERIVREVEFTNARTAFLQAYTAYTALIDNGNTDSLVNQIQFVANNGNAAAKQQLAQDLQSLSPYLSPVVVKVIADEVGITKSVLITLAQANPDNLKEPLLIDYLATARSLTASEIANLESVSQQTTARTTLEEELSQKQQALHLLAHRLLIAAHADSAGYTETYVHNILAQAENLGFYYELADMHRANANTTDETQALAAAAAWAYTDADKAQHQAYLDLRTLANALNTTNRDWSQITPTELADLHLLATNDTGIATARARQIVNMTQGQVYLKLPPLPAPAGNAALQMIPPATEAASLRSPANLVQAYPNPSQDWVVFRLAPPTIALDGRIQVFNAQQQLVFEQSVTAEAQTLRWQPSNTLPSGMYYYRYLDSEQVGNLQPLLRLR